MNPVIIGDATLYHADCIEVMAGLQDNSLDAIISDPPYLINFMGKAFDTQHKSLPGANEGQKMQEWHRRWVTEAYRILKPGGHLAAFGGDRTHHRLMSAMEDVGFELRFNLYWVFGSGFPKSQNASIAIDQHFGVKDQREFVEKRNHPTLKDKSKVNRDGASGFHGSNKIADEWNITEPAHTLAKQWSGYGTALKPAVEPVICVRKPLKVVPFEVIIATNSLIGELICLSLSSVNNVEKLLELSPQDLIEECVSVQIIAGTFHGLLNGESSEVMDMFRSPEMAKTILSIVKSWKTILEELCYQPSSVTTSIETEVITELKILNSLILEIMQHYITQEDKKILGSILNARIAKNNLNEKEVLYKRRIFAQELVGFLTTKEPAINAELNSIAITTVNTVLLRAISCLGKQKKNRPAVEICCVGRKPMIGTLAENLLEWECGAMNLDACRVKTDDLLNGGAYYNGTKDLGNASSYATGINIGEFKQPIGRFPPHLLHDGSDVVKQCFPDLKTTWISSTHKNNRSTEFLGELDHPGEQGYNDSGSASRFFPSLPYDEEDCATLFYCAKASKQDRNQGCELIDQNKYSHDGRLTAIENPYQRNQSVASNSHVSVKPTSLMRWICRLLTPKGGTLLDPFMGSGSTLKAAVLENFICIGIERDDDYFAIAEARVAHVSPEIIEMKRERVMPTQAQSSLF